MKPNEQYIFIIDTPGCTGMKCKCGRDAMFILGIFENNHHLCEQCIATIGKAIIDGLT